jgi:hypothetical protein
MVTNRKFLDSSAPSTTVIVLGVAHPERSRISNKGSLGMIIAS